jgi:hypothetical protein
MFKTKERPMRVVIPGGSGHLGTLLARALHERGDDVVVLSRTPSLQPWRVTSWKRSEIDGADVVVNLAGRSVLCRYNQKHRREILNSRVESTRWVAEAIRDAAAPPRVWLQASTATIYAHRYDQANDEASGRIDLVNAMAPEWRFSVDVAAAWEREVDRIETPATRRVKMRSAIVMSSLRGGAFYELRRLARLGLGGKAGDGKQYVSWIHHRDFVRAVIWLIDHDNISGPVILAAPNPLPNATFMDELRRACGLRIGVPLSKWMLEVGTWLLRGETELVLKSRRVVPVRLLESGFTFDFPDWAGAVRDICHGSAREW